MIARSWMRCATATAVHCVVICLVVVGCGAQSKTAALDFEYSRSMPDIDRTVWGERGTLVSSSPSTPFALSELPPGSSAHTMVYRSVSGITGESTVVSGAVFVPPGDPPPSGWPVVGYAHGTIGVTSDCAPTQDNRLFGDLSAVAIQLQLGYAVAYTDYAGLGEPAPGRSQVHAYLEPKSAAFNLIDAVRAARTLAPKLSSHWLALGASQGGQAAWAAAEYDPLYGEGIDLVGAAALVPVLDISGIVAKTQNATLTTEQLFLYPYIVTGLAAVDTSLDAGNYLHGEMSHSRETLVACHPPESERKRSLYGKLSPSDATPSAEGAARLTARLEQYALPQRPTPVPLLVVYGGADETVLPEWTEVAMGRACALGDTVTRVRMEGQGHQLDPGATLGQWMADRFAGRPATGNC